MISSAGVVKLTRLESPGRVQLVVLGGQQTPLCQGGGAIELEVFAVVKMAFLVEVIVD